MATILSFIQMGLNTQNKDTAVQAPCPLGGSLGFPARKGPGRKNSKETACVSNLCKLGLQKEIKRCERPQQEVKDSGGRRQISRVCMKGGLGGGRPWGPGLEALPLEEICTLSTWGDL